MSFAISSEYGHVTAVRSPRHQAVKPPPPSCRDTGEERSSWSLFEAPYFQPTESRGSLPYATPVIVKLAEKSLIYCCMPEGCQLGVVQLLPFCLYQSLGVSLLLAANTLPHKSPSFLGCSTTTALETIGAICLLPWRRSILVAALESLVVLPSPSLGLKLVKEKARSRVEKPLLLVKRRAAITKSRTPAVHGAEKRSPREESLTVDVVPVTLVNTRSKSPIEVLLYCQKETLEACHIEALVKLCVSFVTAAKNHAGALRLSPYLAVVDPLPKEPVLRSARAWPLRGEA